MGGHIVTRGYISQALDELMMTTPLGTPCTHEQWRQPYVTLHAYAKEAGLHANKQDGRIGPNVTVNVTG